MKSQQVLSKSRKIEDVKRISGSFSEGLLDFIHSDLRGPTRTMSHNGKSYFMSLIDDYSLIVWIYFLANKSDALGV